MEQHHPGPWTYLRRSLPICIFAAAALGTATASPAESTSPGLTAKGIYHDVDRYQRSGLKFHIELDDNGRKRRVSTSYPFKTGDRFTFSFEINRNTHIYVINRTEVNTITPVSAGYHPKKRIDSNFRLSEPRLLFPTSQAGRDNRLASNKAHEIPSRGHFMMDGQSGLEKLYIVISDRRLDFSEMFFTDTGRSRTSSRTRVAALQAKLDGWQDNALVELVPKGIVHDVEGYGATVDAAKPAVIEIDLKHYR